MSLSTNTTLGMAYRRYQVPMPFGITQRDRLLHLYVIGQTGTGKSTLLFNMAMQDAQNLAEKNRETMATLEKENERRAKIVKPSPKSVKPDQSEDQT